MLLVGGPNRQQMQQLASTLSAVARGAVPVAAGLVAGGLIGQCVGNVAACAGVGGVASAALDYYVLGGNKDPRIARKLGYIAAPVMVGGTVATVCSKFHIQQFEFDLKKRLLIMRTVRPDGTKGSIHFELFGS